MASTINEVRRERRAAIRGLKREVRGLDTVVELLQRRLQAILLRKTKIPEVTDLTDIDAIASEIGKRHQQLERGIAAVGDVFMTI